MRGWKDVCDKAGWCCGELRCGSEQMYDVKDCEAGKIGAVVGGDFCKRRPTQGPGSVWRAASSSMAA